HDPRTNLVKPREAAAPLDKPNKVNGGGSAGKSTAAGHVHTRSWYKQECIPDPFPDRATREDHRTRAPEEQPRTTQPPRRRRVPLWDRTRDRHGGGASCGRRDHTGTPRRTGAAGRALEGARGGARTPRLPSSYRRRIAPTPGPQGLPGRRRAGNR